MTTIPAPRKEPEPEVLPDDAILVGCDPGNYIGAGICSSDKLGKPFSIKTSTYYWETGIRGRQKALESWVEKERECNAGFRVACDAFQSSTKTSVYATAMAAHHARGRNFGQMYAFYGAERVALIRFANYIGKQKIMAKLVNQVLPTTSHILVVGDGQFQSSMKGLPLGVSNAFVKK